MRAAVDGHAIALGRRPSEGDLEPVTWAIYQEANRLRADDYVKALAVIHRSGRALASFLESFDLVLTPTLAEPPVPLGEITLLNPNPDEYFDRFWSFTPYTILANTAGVPAMSVPLYWSSEGLPIGVQFAWPLGAEATLLRLASQLEKARPWKNRRPPRLS